MSSITKKFYGLKSALNPFLIWTVIIVCVLIFMIWGVKNLWNSLTNLNIFKVSPSTVTFQTPDWINERFSKDIKRVDGLRDHYSIYENNLTKEVAEIYEGIALIKKVVSIKRVFPNKLHIRFELRKPVALVKTGNNTYLVDDESVLLPKEYYVLPNPEYDHPYVRSKKLSKLPLYGNKWDDKRIQAGIELVKFLRANNIHNLFHILTIDVSNVHKRWYKSRSDIVLWTENNTQIRWGCSSLCENIKELSDEEKLQNLLSIAKTEGTNLRLMEYVDVRWKKPVGKKWANYNKISDAN